MWSSHTRISLFVHHFNSSNAYFRIEITFFIYHKFSFTCRFSFIFAAIPVGTVGQNISSAATVTTTTPGINTQRITVANANTKDGPQKLTTHTYTVKHGDSVQKYVPSFAQLVQTSTGRHIILTNPNQQTTNARKDILITLFEFKEASALMENIIESSKI